MSVDSKTHSVSATSLQKWFVDLAIASALHIVVRFKQTQWNKQLQNTSVSIRTRTLLIYFIQTFDSKGTLIIKIHTAPDAWKMDKKLLLCQAKNSAD